MLNFLEKEGISESRKEAVSYGLSRPIADNNTREGRQKNRRVEIISVTEIGRGIVADDWLTVTGLKVESSWRWSDGLTN